MERGGVRLYRPRSIDHLEKAIMDANISIKESYPLWNAADGVRVGLADNRQKDFLAKKSHTKIDAVVALTLAVGFAIDCEQASPPGPSEEDWAFMLDRMGGQSKNLDA